MKSKLTKDFILFLTGLIISISSFASSGETEYIINGSNQYVCTRSLWANNYAPIGCGCLQYLDTANYGGVFGEGANHDLLPGVIFNPDVPDDRTTCVLNGFFVNKATFAAAILPGVRGIIHHERNWAQYNNLNSSNFFDEGIIKSVNTTAKTITIKYYTNLPSSCVFFNDSTFTYSSSAVIKYEGVLSSDAAALVVGRHVRMYKPRKQVVYAFTPSAFTEQRVQSGGLLLWIRQGFFRGEYNGDTYFAEKSNGSWVNTFTYNISNDVDGYRINPDAYNAVARPGDRIMVAPRSTGATDCFGADYSNFIPQDEESTIGYIIAVGANTVTVRVESCPTGLAKDVVVNDIVVNLDADAEYHLNGITGSTKATAIQVGNFVRILKNASNGMLLVRDADASGAAKLNLSSQPAINAMMPTNNPLTFASTTIGGIWQQKDTIFTTENLIVKPEVYIWTSGSTQIEWFRNGNAISGTKQTITASGLYNIQEYANIIDNGAVFTCKVTTSGGTTTSAPIVLIVSADVSPLKILGASIADKNTIQLTFNKEVQVGTGTNGAERLANYSINNGVTITTITLIGDKKTVIIKTSTLTSGNDYEITVNNVQDVSQTPNVIASNSKVTVSYKVKFRYFRYFIKAKGSLSPRVEEMRYISKGIQYGVGKSYFGLAGSNLVFDNNGATYTQINVGELIGLDMGAGFEILPDSLYINASGGSGRNIYGFRVEGSNDQNNWTELMNRNDTILGVITSGFYYPFNNSGLNADSILVGAKIAQTITFPAMGNKDINLSPITLNATATSGLAVTYAVIEGPASVSGNQLTLLDTGTVWIVASQAGDNNYYAAYPKDQIFKISGTITKSKNVVNKDSKLKVYPNPTTGIINIQVSGIKNVQLINGFGEIIKIISIENTSSIDISELPQGLYLIKSNNEIVKIIKK